MHDGVLGRVHLHVLDDDRVLGAIQVDHDDGRIELFVVDDQNQLLVVERQVDGRGGPAVHDGRNHTRMTQAAARTFALVIAWFGVQFKIAAHDDLLTLIQRRTAATCGTSPTKN